MAKVYGLHRLDLKPDVNQTEFESFVVTQIAPLYQRLPGQTAYLMKADRGERNGKYLLVIELESPAVRDRIYPLDAGDALVAEDVQRALADTEPLWAQLDSYVTEFPDPRCSDYVLVTA